MTDTLGGTTCRSSFIRGTSAAAAAAAAVVDVVGCRGPGICPIRLKLNAGLGWLAGVGAAMGGADKREERVEVEAGAGAALCGWENNIGSGAELARYFSMLEI